MKRHEMNKYTALIVFLGLKAIMTNILPKRMFITDHSFLDEQTPPSSVWMT